MTASRYGVKRFSAFILFFCCLVFVALQHPVTVLAAPGDIVTIAGGGAGDGGPATAAVVVPSNVALDGAGNVYIPECTNNRVRKVDPSGVITTVAGIGGSGYSGDGGPATSARLSCPRGVFVDGTGNIFIAEDFNNRIRKVDTSGIITTVAGNGTGGYSGDGGLAVEAQLNRPFHVAGDAYGNLFIADSFNERIRKVDIYGTITTIAGNGLMGNSGDGGSATAARLRGPYGVAADGAGNIYIADSNNHRIRKVDTAGIITTIAGNGAAAFSGDGGPAIAASLNCPTRVSVDAAGVLYISDRNNNRVRKVDTNGIITTVAGKGSYGAFSGDGGLAIDANLNAPEGVVTDVSGNVYIADSYNLRIRLVDGAGIINTMAGNGTASYYGDGGPAELAGLGSPAGVVMDVAGNLYIADSGSRRVRRVDASGFIATAAGNGSQVSSGDGGPATSAGISYPYGVAKDAAGNLYIADVYYAAIRKVDPTGIITTVAGNGTLGYSGDGGPATMASLNYAFGVAVDGVGNLYIADRDNHRIRKVNTSGIINTIAGNGTAGYSGDGGAAISASLNSPFGITVDAEGNIYFTDRGNQRVRKIDPAGTITTIAGSGVAGYAGDGGQATLASLNNPNGLTIDSSGMVYVVDSSNHRVRSIDASGTISTVAGNGISGFYGDGGPAASASLYSPASVFVDNDGNVYIADYGNNRIRKVIAQGRPTGSVTINAGAVYANNPTVTLALSCTSAAGVCTEMQISDNAGAWPNAAEAFTTAKTWTLLPGDGTKTVYVKCKDSAGTWSNAYQDSIILDTIAPTVTITSPAVGITNNATPLLAYTVSDGTVTVQLDGVIVNKVSGNNLDPLADGPHSVMVQALDAAGNVGFAETAIIVDTAPPTVTITSPASGTTNDNTPLLAYTATEGTFTVKVDGVVVNKIPGTDLDVLTNGLHTVRVDAVDAAGNTGFAETSFTVDAVFPVVTVFSPASGLTNSNTPVLSFTVSEGSTIVKVDGRPVAKQSGDALDLLSDGTHTVRVEATDAAGNTGYAEQIFTVDTTPPHVLEIAGISAGYSHTVLAKSDGTLWAWGNNSSGQLGDGTIVDQHAPVQIGTDSNWISVVAGMLNTLAIKSDGTLWAWGFNNNGQLGDGTTLDKLTPVQIGTENTWISVTTDNSRSLAVKSDGTLWAWGLNSSGGLGDGTRTDRLSPIQIGSDNSWASVAVGDLHTVALKNDGTLWAWGSNSYGQLGDGTSTEKLFPIQIGTDTWGAVAAGSLHTVGLKIDGTLWAWGDNSYGQVGDGTTIRRYSPVQIGTDNTWVRIYGGHLFTIAVKADGTLWAWGSNTYGQLGDGTAVSKTAPVLVNSGNTWHFAAAGGSHSLAVASSGSLWAWGENTSGQLGDATTTRRYSPVLIMDTTRFMINYGANTTNNQSVTLYLPVFDINGVAEMQFSNDNVTWSVSVPFAAAKNWILEAGDGTKTVYAKFKDNAGNWSVAFSASILLDTTAPTVAISSPVSGITNSTTPLLSYSVSDGTVVVKVDGVTVNKVSGNVLDTLSEGLHTVRVESTDAAGNVGFAEAAFTVDIPPTVTIFSPAASSFWNTNTPYLSYTISNGTIVVKVDGVVVNKISGNYLDPLPDGSHTLRVEATDAGGTGFAERTFTVDTVTPTVVISSPTATTTTDNQPLLTYTVSDGAVTVKVDNVIVSKVSGNRLDALQNGQHTVTVIATDAALNQGRADVTFTVNAVAGFSDDLESGTTKWTGMSGLWHAVTGTSPYPNSHSPSQSLWYGQNATGNYSTGATNSGEIISVSFTVPSSPKLTFWSWEQTESSGTAYDTRKVYISTNNGSTWTQIFQSTDNTAVWHQITVDLAAYAGMSAKLKFAFNSVDSYANSYRGWYIDDISVATVTSPPPSGNTKNEGFETGTLTYFPWVTSGNGLWAAKTTTKHAGVYAAEAPVSIVDSQSASLEVTQTSAAGNITFWFSVSSETNWDYLKFYVDGVLKGQWSGAVSWTQASYAVTAGSHIFKWVYSKDSSVSVGSDTAWIDDIAIPIPIPIP